MRPVYALVGAAALAAGSLKDLAVCDPLRKDTRCPPDAAFAGNFTFDLADGRRLHEAWTALDEDRLRFDGGAAGVGMSVAREGQAPTLISNRYLLFGKVSVTVRAAKGPGLVTAVVLKSDSGDEIDWELLGAFDTQAQSNYFFDGQALFNTYNDTYALASPLAPSPSPSSTTTSAAHTYTVEWTNTFIAFSIDDVVRKTWYVGQIPPAKWPQTPMHLKLGLWSVGRDSDAGEIAWAGGLPDWSATTAAAAVAMAKGHSEVGAGTEREQGREYVAWFSRVQVHDYTGLCDALDPGEDEGDGDDVDYSRAGGVEYQYDERTVGWQNVRIKGCARRDGPPLQAPSSSSSSSSQSSAGPSGDQQRHRSGNKAGVAARAMYWWTAVVGLAGFWLCT